MKYINKWWLGGTSFCWWG